MKNCLNGQSKLCEKKMSKNLFNPTFLFTPETATKNIKLKYKRYAVSGESFLSFLSKKILKNDISNLFR